jgi:hypothetical protein
VAASTCDEAASSSFSDAARRSATSSSVGAQVPCSRQQQQTIVTPIIEANRTKGPGELVACTAS